VVGVRNALDFTKGCYVGQEVVARIENLGQPSERLVGLTADAVPDPGATVFDGDEAVGEVTRAAESPMLDRPVALAVVGWDAATSDALRVDGVGSAAVEALPFYEGSDRPSRLPAYE